MTMPLSTAEITAGTANGLIGTALVLEDRGMRVWHLRLAPGETLAAHRHDRPYFWTALTAGQGRSRYGDGSVADVTYQAGDTRYFPDLGPHKAFVHDLTNTGTAELVFVTAEFDPHPQG